jgi:LacI family transcriptional regulator
MRQRAHVIGFFCDTPMIGSGYLAMLQIGFAAGCCKWDSALLIKSFDMHDSTIPEQVKAIIARTPLDGVILPEPLCDMSDVLEILFTADIPVVRITPDSLSSRTLDICIDNEQAAYEVTKHLIDLGHQRISCIRGPADHHDGQMRFEGFRKAMAEAKLPVLEELCPQGSYEFSSGLTTGSYLLNLDNPPTAIFACNDEIAAAVLSTAHRIGKQVPQDISIAGFDDAPIAREVWPPLTTCRQKMELTGYMAVDFLIEPPPGPEARRRPQQHELVIRESTAAPKL